MNSESALLRASTKYCFYIVMTLVTQRVNELQLNFLLNGFCNEHVFLLYVKRNSMIHVKEPVFILQAWKLHKANRLLDMKDTTLVISEDEAREVQQVLETAMLCVQNASEKRPSMFQVTAMLAGDANVDVSPVDEDYCESFA